MKEMDRGVIHLRIRRSREEDYDCLVEIWYQASIKSHSFISQEYWSSKKFDMKNTYLPVSDTYVLEKDEKIVGFVSMVEQYLAALFIDVDEQNQGCGKRLVEYVKNNYPQIQLKVYQQNHDAVNFYLKNDFVIQEESIDQETSEKEYVMVWQKTRPNG